MSEIRVGFSKNFRKNFLNQFESEKQQQIKDRIKEYANSDERFPLPKPCVEKPNRNKVLFLDLEVVIYYDVLNSDWVCVGGDSFTPRAG